MLKVKDSNCLKNQNLNKVLGYLGVFVLGFLLCLSLTACYPMPKNGEYSTIPTTNNADVVGSHNCGLLPSGAL